LPIGGGTIFLIYFIFKTHFLPIKECIILAGGLGILLRSEVADLPKCMAPVADKPFINWVITYLQSQGITSFVFSLGYMHEAIELYVNENYPFLHAQFSVEDEPLVTGGAIKLAVQLCKEENVLVVNSDTLFETNNTLLLAEHITGKSAYTLALKPRQNFDRYGAVTINKNNIITAFSEKKYIQQGLINGRIFLINRNIFKQPNLSEKFSFEKDYLEKYLETLNLMGIEDDGYFIDIRIPKDFKKANAEIKEKYNA
jgi:D-glycero-alpha-D-manno-heptose 1-phosphate guanylyltransferase